MRYFHKAMISNPAFTQSGERIMFEHVGGDDGIIATDSQNVIDSLLERIRLRKGGVSELTEEKYKELQKKKERLAIAAAAAFEARGGTSGGTSSGPDAVNVPAPRRSCCGGKR